MGFRPFYLVACWLLIVPASFGWSEPAPAATNFPVEGILPKAETGASRFLEEHAEFDGRGITVAIFDTGVDPGAIGLQTTTDGQSKIVDLIDGTGGGDVPLSDFQKPEDGILTGLTGRALKVDPQWMNPKGEYRLGIKAAYELFPDELIDRLKEERKRKFAEEQRKLETGLEEQLRQIKSGGDKTISKKECEARLEVLRAAWERYQDPGPVYDCVVFHDGTTFRAAIDTDEDGEFADESTLAAYSVEGKYASFGGDSQLNYSVNFYDSGKILSLVTLSGEHGTHVAGIVAAHHPQHPEHNGLAPGVRIVSVNIGDPRLDSMETGTALLRGLQAVLDHHCELINLSYGEPTSTPDQGALIDRFQKLIREKNVIFVAAAGNDGPALSTLGAPGGTTTAIFGIGAYVSPSMMKAEYGLFENLPGQAYTWSARGPTSDGDSGVDLFAPGGAIAPVPNYALQPGRQMNGTSMASPNACGNIALMLSGLKQLKHNWTPVSILRSLQATAELVPSADPFAQGPGLLQVDKAFQHHLDWQMAAGQNIEIDVSVAGPMSGRGIYLRDAAQTNQVFEGVISLEPRFPENADRRQLLEYQLSLRLVPSADWIQVGQHVLLYQEGEQIPVKVDPCQLAPGAYREEILGLDDAHPERGPLFRIPISVTKSHVAEQGIWNGKLTTETASVAHHFFAVPDGVHEASLQLRRRGGSGNRVIFLHAVQLVPGQSFEAHEWQKGVGLAPDELFEATIPVVAGRTLELCLAQYWNSPGATELELSVRFHGLAADQAEVTLPSDGAPVAVGVRSGVSVERCEPFARMNAWEQMLTPQKYEFKLLTDARDQLWEQLRPWQLVLHYEFEQSQKEDISLRCPEFLHLLYDSPVDSFRIYVMNEQNELIKVEDSEPESLSVRQGKYTVQVELRHTDRDRLEHFIGLPLAVRRSLESGIELPIDHSRAASLREENGFADSPTELDPGERTVFYLKVPTDSEFPEAAQTGDRLIGQLFLTKSRVAAIPLTHPLVISEGEDANSKDDSADAESKTFQLDQAQLQFWLSSLKSLKWPQNKESIDQLVELVLKQEPENRAVRVIKLHLLDNDDRENHLPEIVTAADDVIKLVDQEKLRTWFGSRHDTETPAEKKAIKEHDQEKQDLVDALYRKGRALAYMELPEVVKEHPIADQKALDESFEANYLQLQSWVDMDLQEYFLLKIRRDRRKGDFGQALKLLNRWQKKNPQKKLYVEKQHELYRSLGWEIWSSNSEHWLWRHFPDERPQL